MRHLGSALALMACLFAGCSAGFPSTPTGKNASMVIVNDSQYALKELRTHASFGYLEAKNLLMEPMPINGSIVFYGHDLWYVTIFREKYKDGPVLAFTTAMPVTLERGHGYRLLVFDDSFRITDEPSRLDPMATPMPIYGDPDG